MSREYFFTVEYPGAKTKSSGMCKIRKKGIYLYFLRYGFFLKNREYSLKYDEAIAPYTDTFKTVCVKNEYGEKEEAQVLEGIDAIGLQDVPPLEEFDVVRTPLNKGYIYLINDDPKSKESFRELYVNEIGEMEYVVKKGKKNKEYPDIREAPLLKDKMTYVDVPLNSKYWIAYSHTQWSFSFLKEMISNQSERQKKMKLFECKGIPTAEKYELPSDLNSYKNVRIAFLMGDKRFFNYQKILNIICIDERKQDTKGKNLLYEDMFITLNDPIGAAYDIGTELTKEHTEHRALIQSLQTGEDPSQIFKRMWSDQEKYLPINPPKNTEEFTALFGTALGIYHLTYSKNSEKKYQNLKSYVDDEKIKTVLGVYSRKYKREYINKLRKDFAYFLDSKYFKQYLNYFFFDVTTIFMGKFFLTDFLRILVEHPHDKDRFIDLPEDYEGNDDNVVESFINKTTQEGNPYHKIFSSEIYLEVLEEKEEFLSTCMDFDVVRGTIISLQGIVDTYVKHIAKIRNSEVMLKYLRALRQGKGAVLKVEKTVLLTYEKYGFGVERGSIVPKPENVDKDYLYLKTSKTFDEAKAQARTKRIVLPLTHKGEKLMRGILEHPHFKFLMVSIELANLTVSVKNEMQESQAKNNISTIGAVAQLGYFLSEYQQEKLEMLSSKGIAKNITLGLKGIGATATAVSAAFTCIDSFKMRDPDAAVAWGVSAYFSGVLALEVFGLITLSFWPLTIVTLLAFGSMFLAIYLTDSPIEFFVKNNLLSNYQKFIPKSSFDYIPPTYSQRLIENKNNLVRDEVYQWRNLIKAEQDFYDALCAHRIEEHLSEMIFYDRHKKSFFKNLWEGITSTAPMTHRKLKITITPAKFYLNKSKLFYQLWFFPEGIQDSYTSKTEPILLKDYSIPKNSKTFQIEYNIFDPVSDLVSLSSILVFMTKIEIDATIGEYWHSQREGKEIYYAYKLSPIRYQEGRANEAEELSRKYEVMFNNHIRIGTLDELKKLKTWKRNGHI